MTDQCKYQLNSPVSAGESEDHLAGKIGDETLRRIQAVLADWLRMVNVDSHRLLYLCWWTIDGRVRGFQSGTARLVQQFRFVVEKPSVNTAKNHLLTLLPIL